MSKQMKAIEKDLEQAAASYNPRFRKWTDAEVELVKRFYGKVPTNVLAEKLNRSVVSIQQCVIRNVKNRGMV